MLERFRFLDGLRGVAALMVTIFHLHENIEPAVRGWLPEFLSSAALFGRYGVEIFFVLSGFVIAHSVAGGERSLRYLGWFGLRRSLRLDPPLWAVIAAELLLIRLSLMLFPSLGTPLPSWPQIAANVTYSQHFLGLGDVIPVFWSLCYEVQFYVVLVGSLVILRAAGNRLISGLFVAAFCYSLAIWLNAAPHPLPGLFIDRWFQFALGIAAWALFSQHSSLAEFGMLCAITVGAIFAADTSVYRIESTTVAIATAFVISTVGRAGRIGTVLAGPVIQFLGRISYSLYLIHLSVGWRFISLVRVKVGPELNPMEASAAMLGGIMLSILAAWILHIALEAPAMRLARRVRLPAVQSGQGALHT